MLESRSFAPTADTLEHARAVRPPALVAAALQGPRRARVRFTTRSRLVLAFSLVLLAFVSALAIQVVRLRRMEATFAEMEEHEEQMRLALQLEDAVREQYAQRAHLAAGETSRRAGYHDARARAARLATVLRERLDEPAAAARMQDIEVAAAELDRILHEEALPPGPRRLSAVTGGHDGGYALVSRIEGSVDQLLASLQEATSSFRSELVTLEQDALRWALTLLLAAPVFVAAAVAYLSRSIARPLARVSRGAAALARGDLDGRIAIDTLDEFGALAADFNAMTAALKQHQHRLVQSEKLAGIGRLAAGVAHEINNPLQVILGYLTLHRDATDPRLAEHLALIEQEAMRCKDIVEGLLELSRPAAAITPVPVDLRRLCDEVAAGLRVSLPPGSVALTVEGIGTALGHRAKLRQVLLNLMKNAIEAAGAAGEVKVLVATSDEVAEVAVRDSGPGVSADATTRIFEPFFTTKPAGTGLGLAVSRAIARAHRGDIHFERGSAGGAVFTLRLPRAAEGEPTWNCRASSSSRTDRASSSS